MTAAGYMLTISLTLWLKPQLGPNPRLEVALASAENKGAVWPMVALVAVILVGLYSGVATPSEVSAIGALGALLISYSSGRMTRESFIHAVGGTLRITTMIVAIFFSAHLLGYFVTFSKLPDHAALDRPERPVPDTGHDIHRAGVSSARCLPGTGAIIILTDNRRPHGRTWL